MSRRDIDSEAVTHVATALRREPPMLRDAARGVSLATGEAILALAVEGPDEVALRTALTRFRRTHSVALDAIADAVVALSGDLDLVAVSSGRLESRVLEALRLVPSGAAVEAAVTAIEVNR